MRLVPALLAVSVLALAGLHATRAGEPKTPSIRIAKPLGGQTSARLVSIEGRTEHVDAERLTLVLNGVALSIPHASNAFSTTQVLAPGWNTLRVEGGGASDEVAVYAMVPSKDLRITLTWDTPNTDVDLWVTGPDGEKISYQNKQGKAGGSLDTDVTTGYGPETYTQARTQPGTYRVQAHYYSGRIPTRVTLNVIRGEGSPREDRRVFEDVLLKAKDVVEVGEFVFER